LGLVEQRRLTHINPGWLSWLPIINVKAELRGGAFFIRFEETYDCMNAGGRATQEQLQMV
jgi:hypothetical protein